MQGVLLDTRPRPITTVHSKRVSAAGSRPSAKVGGAAPQMPIYDPHCRVAGSKLSPGPWQLACYLKDLERLAWSISGEVSKAPLTPNARSFCRQVSSVHR